MRRGASCGALSHVTAVRLLALAVLLLVAWNLVMVSLVDRDGREKALVADANEVARLHVMLEAQRAALRQQSRQGEAPPEQRDPQKEQQNHADQQQQHQQQQLGLRPLRVGLCKGDALSRFAVDVGRELARRAGRALETVELQLDGDELGADYVFCERGSTGVVDRVVARREPAARVQRVPWRWPDGSKGAWWSPRSGTHRSSPPPGALYAGSGHVSRIVLRGSAQEAGVAAAQPARPVIVRFHMEPWETAVKPGVDIAIDTKTRLLQNDVVGMYAPYLVMGFAKRGPGMGEPGHLTGVGGALPEGGGPPAAQRRFAGFLASYCSARLVSGSFRAFFFNALAERFAGREETLAMGNCQPRMAKGKPVPIRLKADDPDLFDSAVRAFQNFRFGIAFENSEMPGYITEKIANVKLAGAVPIYWGAPDVMAYLNPDAFVWCNVSTAAISWDRLFKEAEASFSAAEEERGRLVKTRPPEWDARSQVLDMVEQQVLRLLGPDPFKHCLDTIERLNADPEAYRRMREAPLVLRSSGLFDPATYADGIEAVLRIARQADAAAAAA